MKKRELLIINLMIIFSKVNVFAASVVAVNDGGTNCETLLSTGGLISSINKNILIPLKFIAPILLLVLTTIDFAKVVFSDSKDGMSKVWKNFTRRAVGTLLVFFASNIVAIIYGLISGVGPCFKTIYGSIF